ncbi:MAG: polysaccharide biosynthesis protein GumE [Pseudomonadota bacterium]|nr:polysaccharide biosynthesis protein GumE [Pseudomonadota bacterium]
MKAEHELSSLDRLATIILVAATVSQALLCLVNTNLMPVSRPMIGALEALILLLCVPVLLVRLLPGSILLACLIGANLSILALISGELNPKLFRDLAIPLCLFWVGYNVGKLWVANRILLVITVLILAFAVVELFFLDIFVRYFDIYQYYVDTGSLKAVTEYERESRLQLNGMRPEGIGRTILPGLLGSHRVSSIMLEPVSLGNLAVLLYAWWLSFSRSGLGSNGWMPVCVLLIIALTDSRFAMITVLLLTFIRFCVPRGLLSIAMAAPLFGLALILTPALLFPEYQGDNYLGRLIISGKALLAFDASTFFGILDHQYYGDEGYAYAFSGFGFPLLLVLWVTLWLLPVPNMIALRFRAMISVYIALLLCISGTSLFAFKSAAILWFLVGVSLQNPARPPSRSGSRDPAPAAADIDGGFAHGR